MGLFFEEDFSLTHWRETTSHCYQFFLLSSLPAVREELPKQKVNYTVQKCLWKMGKLQPTCPIPTPRSFSPSRHLSATDSRLWTGRRVFTSSFQNLTKLYQWDKKWFKSTIRRMVKEMRKLNKFLGSGK